MLDHTMQLQPALPLGTPKLPRTAKAGSHTESNYVPHPRFDLVIEQTNEWIACKYIKQMIGLPVGTPNRRMNCL